MGGTIEGLEIVYIDNEPIPTDASINLEEEVLKVARGSSCMTS
jgi:hypothetical protein